MKGSSFEWFDLARNRGVLELAERVTAPGPPLELHLLVLPLGLPGERLTWVKAAWWEDERGRHLRRQIVGRA